MEFFSLDIHTRNHSGLLVLPIFVGFTGLHFSFSLQHQILVSTYFLDPLNILMQYSCFSLEP